MIVPGLADWCGIEMVDEHGESHQVAVAHVDPGKVQMAHDLRRRYPPDPDGPTGVPAILRGGPAELYTEIPAELIERAARDEEHLRLIRELGMRSAMAVPMRIGDQTLGVITLVSAESGRRFDEDDLGFVEDLALRAATAVQNSRLYAAQERVAHTLQASLLPERLPELPGWETSAAYQAGERDADVGGDFYDILPVEGGHMVMLGDVTGKGVEAAALTSLVRHSARMAARFDPRPARVLSLVNEVLRQQPRLSLVTAVCALVSTDGDRATVTVASAGHPLPLRRPSDQAPAPLGDHGVLLGVEGQDEWTETVAELAPGETLLFYTDGVTETPGERGRFGDARLRDAMARARETPEELLTEIDGALREFQSGVTLDDRAMLALRFVGARRRGHRRCDEDALRRRGRRRRPQRPRRGRLSRPRRPLRARARAVGSDGRGGDLRGPVRGRRRAALALRLPGQPAAALDRRRAGPAVRDPPAADLVLHAGAGVRRGGAGRPRRSGAHARVARGGDRRP